MNYNTRALQAALIEAVERINPRLFVTLVFHYDVTYEIAQRRIISWANRIESRAHGKRWAQYPAAKRLRFYAFPEYMDGYPHYHLAMVAPADMCEIVLKEGADIWRQLTTTGHLDAQWIKHQAAVARYVTKAVMRAGALEHYVAYAPNATCK